MWNCPLHFVYLFRLATLTIQGVIIFANTELTDEIFTHSYIGHTDLWFTTRSKRGSSTCISNLSASSKASHNILSSLLSFQVFD